MSSPKPKKYSIPKGPIRSRIEARISKHNSKSKFSDVSESEEKPEPARSSDSVDNIFDDEELYDRFIEEEGIELDDLNASEIDSLDFDDFSREDNDSETNDTCSKNSQEETEDIPPIVIWELPPTNLTKGQIQKTHIPIDKSGCYQFVFTKLDKVSTRALSIRFSLVCDKSEIKCANTGLGGLKYSKSTCLEFRAPKPGIAELSFKCNNLTNFGNIQFKAILYKSHKIHGRAIDKEDALVILPPKDNLNVSDDTEDCDGHTLKKDTEDDEVLDVLQHEAINGKRVIQHTLVAGHYYIGVRNDDTRMGIDFRKLSVDLRVYSVSDNTEIILSESVESLKGGELPWRKQFEITEEQAPVILTITLKVASMLQGTASLKLSRTPDPASLPEQYKKYHDILLKVFLFLGVLLFISYASQIVSYIFALTIPFTKVTVRGILTVVVSIFLFIHRAEIISKMKENSAVIKDKIGFFKGLDELETSVQKIKFLQERSKVKRARLLQRKKEAREL